MKYDAWPIEALLAEVGRRIRQERLNQDLTQEELAERAGISATTIKKLESNSPNPTLRVVLLVMRALGTADRLDAIFPEPSPSPIQAAKLRRETRQRASGGHRDPKDEDSDWQW